MATKTSDLPPGSSQFGCHLLKDFLIDSKYRNLNHGSFGTYPRIIQTALRRFQDLTELRPDAFIRYDYKTALDHSRELISNYLNVPTETCVFVPNATTGINTVLRNLVFAPGDVIIYFDTIYGACERTISYITETTPATAVKVRYTYPISDTDLLSRFSALVAAEKAKGNTPRLAIFDTVVSMPGVRVPFERLTALCRAQGILSCIDGAHGIGHIPLDLHTLDPDFFVSNCHKWLFAPRGCAVFYVPERNQSSMRSTLPTSHGFLPRPSSHQAADVAPLPRNPLPPSSQAKSDFVTMFEYVGTLDASPYLCIPAALAYRRQIGGEEAIMQYCHKLAREAGDLAAARMGTVVLENAEGTLGGCCLRNVRLPLEAEELARLVPPGEDVGMRVAAWMAAVMVQEYDTFMAVFFYAGGWWVRFSAQVYTELTDFEWGTEVLLKLCERVRRGEFLKPAQVTARL